ncbi:MAG: carboxypeptidase regulatory-like domain-containing protein [Candidatus Hydrogenedentes bacterium]|nr:carboxypeptidase regulatory-like domain-containing protein [Candidatus Hydrogenedentota bacterium]
MWKRLLAVLPLLCICAAAQDAFEDDDATPVLVGVDAAPLTHDFHDAGDVDSIYFYAEAGTTKTVRTLNLGPRCDTFILLKRPNGSILEDDNSGGGLASEVTFIVDQTGLYTVQVYHPNPSTFGTGTSYELEVIEEAGPLVTGRIAGTMRDAETAAIIAGATISLLNFDGASRTSGTNGAYEFLNIRTNRYLVEGRAPGYEPLQQTVTVASASRFVTLNFSLTPLPPPPVLSVTPAARNVADGPGNTTFAVSNTGEGTLSWSAEVVEGETWLSVRAPGSGTNTGTITADVMSNGETSPRTGTIRVTAPGADNSPADVTVTQAAAAIPILEVTPASREVGPGLGTTSFTVTNGGGGLFTWTGEVTTGNSWLQISSGASGGDGETITLAVAENPDENPRTGQLRITAPGAQQSPLTVSVTQLGNNIPEIAPEPASVNAGAVAGTTTIAVNNSGNGTLAWTAAVTNGQDWLRVTAGASGSEGDTLSLAWDESRSPAPRTGTVTITAAGASNSPLALNVVQAADTTPEIAVVPDSLTVASAAAPRTLAVSNGRNGTLNWTATVTSGMDWISITSGAAGGNSGTIALQISANGGNATRTGTVEIADPNAANSPVAVEVTQAGQQTPILAATPPLVEAPPAGGAFSLSVANDGGGTMLWTAAVTAGVDWMSVTPPDGGSNDGSVEFVASANAGVAVREGEITITATGALGSPAVIPVTQLGQLTPVLQLDPLEADIGPDGGVQEFRVTNGGGGSLNWSAVVASGASWLAVSSGAAGTAPGAIRVSASPNNTAAERAGRVQVRALGAVNAPIDLAIRQQASCRPPAPAGLTASDASRSDGVFVQWNPVADADQYRLYRSSTPELADAVMIASLLETQYLDLDAPTPQAGGGCGSPAIPVVQYYWVAAENSCGAGPFSRGEIGSRGNGAKAADMGGALVLGLCAVCLAARRRHFRLV